MSRRAAIAAALVGLALTVGVVRTLTGDPEGMPQVSAEASANPRAIPAPSPSVAPPADSPTAAGSATSAQPATAEPVDQRAGAPGSSTLAGRDVGPGDRGSIAPDRRAWEPVAGGFGRSFTTVGKDDTSTTWRARLRPYVTAGLDKQLATVDVANVPGGRLDGLDLLDGSDEQVIVQATYAPGWAMALYLISDGHDEWKVYRYDRLEP